MPDNHRNSSTISGGDDALEAESDAAQAHREDCDCHECERGELRRQFYNDAVGTRPWRGEGLAQ